MLLTISEDRCILVMVYMMLLTIYEDRCILKASYITERPCPTQTDALQ
jgi:hypothetical protein